MKRFALFAAALLMCLVYGCNEEPEPTPVNPFISLEKGTEGATTLTFKATIKDATKAAYMVVKDGEELPALADILASGTELDPNVSDAVEYTAEGLEPGTKYQVVAAASNNAKSVGSNTLYMTTVAADEVTVSLDVVHVGYESMSFRANITNATRAAYIVMYASKSAPEPSYVLINGEEIDLSSREAVDVTGLECKKEYQLIVVAEGAGATVMSEPVLFTTNDDPSNILTHNYTRAKGTKYGANYFMMFSYEDPNEAENFAYNEQTLSLDMYGDPEKDYLPAGTYPVLESNEPPCVSAYRYSNYGYNDQIRILSGEVVVEIDPETKAYSFDIDIYLADGRHMQAYYTGDVDGMEVVDIITVNTNFTEASATTGDNGAKWMVVLKDSEGNEAHLDVLNSRKASYLVNNTYTISSSTESEEGKPADTTPEAGDFDAASSYFVLADGEQMPFATGSFHVTIDWDSKTYQLALYATLGKNYVIEAKYDGAIEGISLEASSEIIDVVMNSATARSFEGNANWYLTFAQTENGTEKYRLTLDCYCPASPYLPTGVYKFGVGTGEGYISADASKLLVSGEGEYHLKEVTATVTTNAANKTYIFDITARVEDGRTFKMSYMGVVDGMEIVDAEDTPDEIVWTSFSARHWYSDNWALTVVDAEGKYTIEFDLRTGDSSLNYIPSATYTIGYEGMYINDYYTTLNGNKSAFKEMELILDYDESTCNYAVSFDLTHADGRNFKGSYNGPIAGSPKQ